MEVLVLAKSNLREKNVSSWNSSGQEFLRSSRAG